MEDVLAPVDGLRPAVVGGEVGDGEGEAVTGPRAAGGKDAAHIWLTLRRPDGGAAPTAGVQQRHDEMGSDEAGAAGDEDLDISHVGRFCQDLAANRVAQCSPHGPNWRARTYRGIPLGGSTLGGSR